MEHFTVCFSVYQNKSSMAKKKTSKKFTEKYATTILERTTMNLGWHGLTTFAIISLTILTILGATFGAEIIDRGRISRVQPPG